MKILFGSIVVDARGRLNGHVFKKTAFGNSITALALPRSQTSWKSNSALHRNVAILREYDKLTELQKSQWREFAVANPLRNSFGVARVISARAMFVKCAQMYRFPSIDIPAADILSNVNPPSSVTAISVAAATGFITWNTTLINEQFQIVIYLQQAPAGNQVPLTNRWRRIENHIISSLGNSTPAVSIFPVVGAPRLNHRYFVRYKIVNASGWGTAEFSQPLSIVGV